MYDKLTTTNASSRNYWHGEKGKYNMYKEKIKFLIGEHDPSVHCCLLQ